jgi:hypothetical protein
MKEYPATSRQFNINDQFYIMQMLPLFLLAKMEDESVEVSFFEIIEHCTNIPKEMIAIIPDDQLNTICDNIIEYSNDEDKTGDKKKVISLIAWFMNKGHFDAQYYRVDFVRALIKEMVAEQEAIKESMKAKK